MRTGPGGRWRTWRWGRCRPMTSTQRRCAWERNAVPTASKDTRLWCWVVAFDLRSALSEIRLLQSVIQTSVLPPVPLTAQVDAGDGDDGWEGDEEPEPAGPRAGPLGVWPGASLLNHSCMPNTVAFVVG